MSNPVSEPVSEPASEPISEREARLALSSIEHRRRQVSAEIDVPWWYWCVMAAGWVALGVLADEAPAWATAAGTVLFGALHAAVAPRYLSGRRGSPRLSVRPELVSRRIPAYVVSFLVVMTAATVGFALLLHADGARHPAILASGAVAVAVLCGGTALMDVLRRHAL